MTDFKEATMGIGPQQLGVATVCANSVVATPDYRRAFLAWESLLGEQYVQYHPAACTMYATTTLPQGTLPAGVLQPESTKEVQEVVNIARRFYVPLYAISRGKNWGYGDACARTNGQVIVDLSRLNRIV